MASSKTVRLTLTEPQIKAIIRLIEYNDGTPESHANMALRAAYRKLRQIVKG